MVRRALALVAALTLFATACVGSESGVEVLGPATTEGSSGPDDTRAGGGDTTTSTTTRRPDTDPERFGAGEDFSVTAALDELPADYDVEGVIVTVGDLVTAATESGLPRPADLGDSAALRSWVLELSGASPKVFVPFAEMLVLDALQRVDEIDAELGWSIVDVEAFVEASRPPRRLMVATGEAFGPEVMDDADVVELADGVYTAGEGEDHRVDLQGSTAARRTGAPLRMAVEDGRIAVGSVRADVTGWLAGDERTLADADRYRQVAEALDGTRPYAALLHRSTMSPGWDPGGGLTAGYEIVGLGWSVAGDQAVITLVNHFGDDATAAAQVEPLRALFTEEQTSRGQPLSSYLTLDSVRAEGPVTVTVLQLAGDTRPVIPFQMLQRVQVPFA